MRKFLFSISIICGFLAIFLALNSQIRTAFFKFINFKTHKITTLNISDLGDLPKFEIGDLVFRLGDIYDSILISQISDFKYSHVGIIVNTKPLNILHATTNDDKNRQNQVILSSFDEFLSHSVDFGVLRMNFLNLSQKQQLTNSLKSRLGEKFVLAKKGEKNLYCTTLLEQEIQKIAPFSPKYLKINTAVFDGFYLMPKAIWEYNQTEILYEYKK